MGTESPHPDSPGPSQEPTGWKWALKEAGMVMLGFIPLGMGLGILASTHGFPWWAAPILSGVVFAGSVEFILVGLISAGTPVASIAVTTLLVNSRHLFYGFSFPLEKVTGRLAKTYSIYSLCDEAFAILTGRVKGAPDKAAILWTQFGLQFTWVFGSLLGAILGAGLLGEVKGIGFILVSLFVVLAMDAYRARPDLSILFMAIGSAVVAIAVAPHQMLLVALCLFMLAILSRFWLTKKAA